MKNKSNKRKKGFTLIEVLVVVLITGVLAAIAMPLYLRSTEKSKMVQGVSTLTEIAKAQSLYNSRRGQYTNDIFNLNIDLADFDNNKDSATGDTFADEYFSYTVHGTDLKKAVAQRQTGEYELEINYATGELICHSQDNQCNILNLPTEYTQGAPVVSPSTPSYSEPTPEEPNSNVVEPEEENESQEEENSHLLSCTGNLLYEYDGYVNSTYSDIYCKYKANEFGGYDIFKCNNNDNYCIFTSYDSNKHLLKYQQCSSLDKNGECVQAIAMNLENSHYDANGHIVACEVNTPFSDACLLASGEGFESQYSMVYETDEAGRITKAIPCLEFNEDYTCKTYKTGADSHFIEYDENGRKKMKTTCYSGSQTIENGGCDYNSSTEYIYNDPDSINADKIISCHLKNDGTKQCGAQEYIKDENGFITQVRTCSVNESGECQKYLFAYYSDYDDKGNMLSWSYNYSLDDEGNPAGESTSVRTYTYGDDGSYFIYNHEDKTCTLIDPSGKKAKCIYHS